MGELRLVRHWRSRHLPFRRDTFIDSPFIPMLIPVSPYLLQQKSCTFCFPWRPHCRSILSFLNSISPDLRITATSSGNVGGSGIIWIQWLMCRSRSHQFPLSNRLRRARCDRDTRYAQYSMALTKAYVIKRRIPTFNTTWIPLYPICPAQRRPRRALGRSAYRHRRSHRSLWRRRGLPQLCSCIASRRVRSGEGGSLRGTASKSITVRQLDAIPHHQ